MDKEDLRYLSLLSTFHYVVGSLLGLLSLIPFLHVFMGIMVITGQFANKGKTGQAPPEAFGYIFIVMGLAFIIFGLLVAALVILTGKKLKQRKNRVFCLVIAGIECMFTPFGTILGIFTIITLTKEPVKKLFDNQEHTYLK